MASQDEEEDLDDVLENEFQRGYGITPPSACMIPEPHSPFDAGIGQPSPCTEGEGTQATPSSMKISFTFPGWDIQIHSSEEAGKVRSVVVDNIGRAEKRREGTRHQLFGSMGGGEADDGSMFGDGSPEDARVSVNNPRWGDVDLQGRQPLIELHGDLLKRILRNLPWRDLCSLR